MSEPLTNWVSRLGLGDRLRVGDFVLTVLAINRHKIQLRVEAPAQVPIRKTTQREALGKRD